MPAGECINSRGATVASCSHPSHRQGQPLVRILPVASLRGPADRKCLVQVPGGTRQPRAALHPPLATAAAASGVLRGCKESLRSCTDPATVPGRVVLPAPRH